MCPINNNIKGITPPSGRVIDWKTLIIFAKKDGDNNDPLQLS
jgi:hypothetical protein